MSKLLRVTQLDAVQLDNEILRILKTTVENASKYLAPGFTVPFEPEINLIIKLLVLNYSVINNSATFGQRLLLVKYDNLTYTKTVLYVLFSSFGYIRDRCELSNPLHVINKHITTAEYLIQICQLINLAVFLKTGNKPNLIDRVLGLNQSYVRDNMPRQFNNKYLTREVLWNGFIEILVFLLPLINYHKIKRIFRNLQFRKNTGAQKSEHRVYNIYSRCPHCLEIPIHPHHMGCAHVFCYTCLKSNQLADSKYECPLCGYNDFVCERVAV